jgi:acylphosphatase
LKGSFCIKAEEENAITEKGVRAFIMERLLNSPFSKGSAVNVDAKTVQVQIEGDEKQVKAFMKKLEKEIVLQFGNPAISFTQFQEDNSLEIPDLMRSSQALVVGQLQKGINVQLDILSTLKQLPKELASALKE